MWRRLVRRLAWAVTALVVLGVVAWAFPPARARMKAAAVLTRALDFPLPRPFASRVSTRMVEVAPGSPADLYLPSRRARGIVIVPGATPRGRKDPRVIRLARSLAGARRAVLVPELALYRRVFEIADVEAIVRAAEALEGRTGGKVGLLGLSYGGSLALLAAQDARIAARLEFVATFGAYADLLNVVQGVTTGATLLDGRAVPWRTIPEAREILTDAAVGLAAPGDQTPLRRALQRRDPAALSPAARAMYELLTNTDPRRTEGLAAALPEGARATLRGFSPLTGMSRIRAPLFLMQSERDPATPPAEARRLHAAVPAARLIVLREFLHVNPPGERAPLQGIIADGWGGWRFTSWVLAAQE